MEIFLAWLLGCTVFWYLLRRFTSLGGGVAVGVTILAGSLPVWVLLFSLFNSSVDSSVGVIVLLILGMAGGGFLLLGLVVILLSALFGGWKKMRGPGNDASLPVRSDTEPDRAEKGLADAEVRRKDDGDVSGDAPF